MAVSGLPHLRALRTHYHRHLMHHAFLLFKISSLIYIEIYIPKVGIAVLKFFLIFGIKYLPQGARLTGLWVKTLFGKIPFEQAHLLYWSSVINHRGPFVKGGEIIYQLVVKSLRHGCSGGSPTFPSSICYCVL